MSWSDWCESKYNLDNWQFIDHGGYGEVRSHNNAYSLLVNYTLAEDGTIIMDTMDVFLSPDSLTMVSVLPAL